MEKHQAASRPKKPSAQERANLDAALSDLLEQAGSSPEAAEAALRACLKLRRTVPKALLTKENIANTLSLREIPCLLDRLSISPVSLDISAGLGAMKVLVDRELRNGADLRTLLTTSRAMTSKLAKLATDPSTAKQGAKSRDRQGNRQIHFAEGTLSSATDLALWMFGIIYNTNSKKAISAYPLVLRWVQAVEAIWRRSPSPGAACYAVRFFRSLQKVLRRPVYADLKEEPSIAAFLNDSDAALLHDAGAALLEARLRDLESILSVVARDENEHNRLLSTLQNICQSRPSELIPEAVEWVARQIEIGAAPLKSPSPADESQSSALDYVAMCLLTAWDAATEGSRSARALESLRRLARDLYKVDLVGALGEIVGYSERQHELTSQVSLLPDRVEIMRPAVQWSDGIRTRFLVRAVVKPSR
jgi:hypothetical protein